MSQDSDSDSLKDFEKPKKRVRFNEDPSVFFIYEQEIDCKNEDVKSESENSPENERVSHPIHLTNCDKHKELMENNKEEVSSIDSCDVECISDLYDPPAVESLNNNSGMADLNFIIEETKGMKISSGKNDDPHLSSAKSSTQPSSDSTSENKEQEATKKPFTVPNSPPLKSVTSCVTRKRSKDEAFIEKQSSKLNDCLHCNMTELNTAVDFKNAVYNAWNIIKSESAKNENTAIVPDDKTVIKPKVIIPNRIIKKGILRKKSTRKFSLKMEDLVSEKKKEDIEESKLAFRAWKKRKDELLNQQIAEKRKKEEKKRLDTLMNERMRKNDAESAYLAWVAYKASVKKKEKRKNLFLLEKQKEKLAQEIKRNNEAAIVYYEWLRSKIFSKDNYSPTIYEDKPPWTPPGKVKNFV